MKALIINCTLKPSGETSNTQALIDKAVALFKEQNVECETLRFVDYNVKPGVSNDEGEGDQWPEILQKIRGAEIFILAAPVWVGHLASTAQRVIERLDAIFHEEENWDTETGRYFTYNKVAGCLITGNEDGAHSSVAQVLWAMQEFGFTIPPNVNSYWVGPAGPGPSYLKAGGKRHLFTNKTLHFTVANLTWMARLLEANPMTVNLKKLSELAEAESETAG